MAHMAADDFLLVIGSPVASEPDAETDFEVLADVRGGS